MKNLNEKTVNTPEEVIEASEMIDIDDLETEVGGRVLRASLITKSALNTQKFVNPKEMLGSYRTVMCPW